MIDSQRGALRRLGYNHLISNKRECNNVLKTPPKYRKLNYNKNKKAQKITHTLAIFVDHGIMAHRYIWEPRSTPQLGIIIIFLICLGAGSRQYCRYTKSPIYHDGLANENSRIALSNDPVFNNFNDLIYYEKSISYALCPLPLCPLLPRLHLACVFRSLGITI